MNTQKKCGCGRSPTGSCIGWHSLNEADYKKAKSDYEFEQYQKRAESLWFKDGSCTGGKSSA
ncbi:MAG: hypothetical protein ACR2IJ_09705 [Fluviibacter sp.]|jgi:hypothetical protein